MKTKKFKEYLGNTVVEFTTEIDKGEYLDTIISINGKDIMVIAGSDIEDFIMVLHRLNSYAI